MFKSHRIDGSVVGITGAGQGIGADVARRLVARGARVALIDRVPGNVETLATELGAAAYCHVADVTDPDATTDALDSAARTFGRLDAVVANAGVMDPATSVAETTSAQFRRLLDVNVAGVFHTIHAALPHLHETNGYALCVSSLAGLVPTPMIASYVASKHAVDGFARSLRLELSATGVDVGVAYFGVIDTPMAHSAIGHVGDVWDSLPARVRRPVPVGEAGGAIVRGIERRSSSVFAPSWMGAVLLGSRGSSSLYGRAVIHHPAMRRLVRTDPGTAPTSR
ncbi:SDR family NAD(P)-dependent oxidoreductase [Williamsia herbipolensis]|uniref:SDR family NAD(P)-dependent oxidoreductase n=1 Tax=Williamsia herbipolensis TaxID=1603258 RepID=A0AAU4JYD0_9NOCA|nr:SDR family NAD(P)-dependent oxidoreductase [Williamsia herbipolensis]